MTTTPTFRDERFHWGDDVEFDWHPESKAAMYYVTQGDGVTFIRMPQVDGAEQLAPDDMWFGQRAGDLVAGVYDETGKLIAASSNK